MSKARLAKAIEAKQVDRSPGKVNGTSFIPVCEGFWQCVTPFYCALNEDFSRYDLA